MSIDDLCLACEEAEKDLLRGHADSTDYVAAKALSALWNRLDALRKQSNGD